MVGIDAIRGWLKKGQAGAARFEITEYKIDFEEVHVLGKEAVEWGRTRIAVRPKGASRGMSVSGNILRVLRRQPDGTWKVARAIWNVNPPGAEPAR